MKTEKSRVPLPTFLRASGYNQITTCFISPTPPLSCLSLYHSDLPIPTFSSLLLLLSILPHISSPLPRSVLFVAVPQRPSYPHLPPLLLLLSILPHISSPPYTSTHHSSSSLFCCYIIATITTTSTMQSLTPSLQIVLPAPSHLLLRFSHSPVLFVAVSQRPSYPHLFLPPPSLINSSFHLISPPYTSTHHPSSSLFCCYIIATITIPSTRKHSPHPFSPFLYHPKPSPFLPPSRPVCRCITATILSTPLPPSSFSYHFFLPSPPPLTPPHTTHLLLYFVAIS